jgi:hypothetical protein
MSLWDSGEQYGSWASCLNLRFRMLHEIIVTRVNFQFSAHFSRTNGCRLLTTDQNNQVRVYLAPEWHLEKTILHPHRFFQHITPIKVVITCIIFSIWLEI